MSGEDGKGRQAAAHLRLEKKMRGGDIQFDYRWIGGDLLVIITGGKAHIGSISAISPAEGTVLNTEVPDAECGAVRDTEDGNAGSNAGACRGSALSFAFPGHRDDVVSCRAAKLLSEALHCRGAVVCGLHYDNITKEEIGEVLAECDQGVNALLSRIKETR